MSGRVYALYDYDGTINNGNTKANINRFNDRHIQVTEGDELEIIEDDDEHIWKVMHTSLATHRTKLELQLRLKAYERTKSVSYQPRWSERLTVIYRRQCSAHPSLWYVPLQSASDNNAFSLFVARLKHRRWYVIAKLGRYSQRSTLIFSAIEYFLDTRSSFSLHSFTRASL